MVLGLCLVGFLRSTSPAGAQTLSFQSQPTNTTAGVTIASFQVLVRDAMMNPVMNQAVTISIGSGPAGGTLSGTATQTSNVMGLATFNNLSLNRSGDYTLLASATGFPNVTSNSFTISPGAAAAVSFQTQPGNGSSFTAGTAITPFTVLVQDGLGNNVANGTTVTLTISSNPGSGTLSGTTMVTTTSGVANFNAANLSINRTGVGYTLQAAAGSGSAVSNSFNINPAAAATASFTGQPTNTVAGVAISTVTVQVLDAFGNAVANNTGVTMAIGTNPGGGVLSGTTNQLTSGGLAQFTNLSINRTGNGYTLTATSGAASVTSNTFNITPAAAASVSFSQQPGNTVAGVAISPAVTVTVQDAFGNNVANGTSVVMAIGNNPGGSTLSGTTTQTTTNGVATFNNLSLNRSGNNYTLQATVAGAPVAFSGSFNITPAAAATVTFTQQPTNTIAGVIISPAITVTVQDAFGNNVANGTSVVMAIGTNPGNGTLSGTTSQTTTTGVATFNNLSLNRTGTGYTLTATVTGVVPTISATFNITPAAPASVSFGQQPTNAVAGVNLAPAVTAQVFDALGNLVGTGVNVTVAIGTNAGGGTLSGTLTQSTVNGVSTFNNLSINRTGTGYTLTATVTGLPAATSATFDITPAAAASLSFTTQPTNTTAGQSIMPAVAVTVLDAFGNAVANGTSVTVAIGANPGGGTLSGTATQTTVSGIASFANLSINRTGAGYTLTATVTGLPAATSSTFTITPAAATTLSFMQQPTNAVAGAALAPAVTVGVLDAFGNLVTNVTTNVTVVLGANPSGSTLSGTTTVPSAGGIATFGNLSLNRSGNGYTLVASATGTTSANSATFNITAGAAAQLAFSVAPSTATAGSSISPAVEVTIQDALGNTVTTATNTVTVALGANPGSGTLSGTLSAAAVAGVASFANLSINRSGVGYTLTASSGILTGATSPTFNIVAGPGTQLAFNVQPISTTAGVAIAPAIQVCVKDALGNLVSTATNNITLAIGNNPGGSTLSGTTTVTAAGGTANFSTLSLNRSGTGYTLVASATGLTGATSAAFNIVAGGAAQLGFSVQPSNAVAGATIAPAVTVQIQDAFGNMITTATNTVTLAIGTNPSGGVLSGTVNANAVAGVATFSNLSLNRAGAGYTLTAAATGLTGATSAAFTISAGAASQLVFTVQPVNTVAGAAITPALQVAIQDAQGNLVNATTAITLAIGSNPGSGTLSGTTTVNAVNGVATLSTLSINRAGNGYTLTAGATGLTGATSNQFNITAGAAATLAFLVQPSNSMASTPLNPAVQVVIQDTLGNTITNATNAVTLAIGTNPGSGTLSGTTTVNAVSGVATFGNLSLNRSGTGYTLVANSAGLASVTSSAFNITAGTAAGLLFTVQPPATGTAGQSLAPALQVSVVDGNGNVVTTATNSITIALSQNPGVATLSGTTTMTAVAGVTTFSNLSLNRVGTGYTFAASTTGLNSAVSNPFNIAAAGAAQLALIAPTPSIPNTGAGVAIAPAVQVAVQDAFGNTVTTATNSITVALGANPGGGTLSGVTTVIAINGVATFNTLSIDRAGTGYTLTAAATGFTTVTGAAFNIVAGNATRVGFIVQPTNTAAGATITPAVQVAVQDQFGNTVTTATNQITIAIGTNPGSSNLSGTATITAINGIATFSNLSLNRAGNGYTLMASAGGLTSGTSNTFNITAGAAAQLGFTVQPTNTVAGLTIAPAVVVAVQDANGNTITTAANSITIAIGTNAGGATLSGTLTATAVNGLATFNNLSLDRVGNGYTLSASATGVTAATSALFNITTGAATRLGFVVQPTNTVAGQTMTPSVQVAVQDAQGNTITTATNTITLALGSNPGGGTLSGTLAVAAVNGIATFNGLSINLIGTGYTMMANATGLTNATSNAFNITAGNAARLGFTVSPVTGVAGAVLAPAVQVAVQDAFGNTITTATNSITVALGTNPTGAALGGTRTLAAVNGIATFNDLTVSLAGTNYTLTATAGGLTGAVSAAFNQTAPAPTITTIQPASGANNTAISVLVTGTNFAGGATLRLTRTGQTDRVATNVQVTGSTNLNATLDLNGLVTGAWNVVVANLDGQSGTLLNGFTVNAPAGVSLGVGLAGNQVSLISLPDVPVNFDPFAGLLDRNRNSALARWNPQKASDPQFSKYEFLIDGGTSPGLGFTTVENGRGYWRKGSTVFTSNFITRTTPFDLPVFAGAAPFQNWNLVGVPFTSSIDLSSTQVMTGTVVRTFGEAVTAGIVSDFVWTYPVFDGTRVTSNGYQLVSTTFPNAITKLDPGRGYWMAFGQDSMLRTNPPTAQTQRTLASARRQAVAGDHWLAQLRVRSGEYSDDFNYFGTSANPRALLKPPAAPEGNYVALTFQEATPRTGGGGVVMRNAAALRASDARARNEWEFVVETNLNQEVELSWPDLGTAPRELALYLIDVETGRRVYMRTQTAYAFRPSSVGPRRFRITAEPRTGGNLLIRDMTVLANSSRNSTVNFVLGQSADLEVRLISPAGKIVNQQMLLSRRLGLNSVTIQHQDTRGYVLPRGFYLVEVTASSPEGQVVKALKGFAVK